MELPSRSTPHDLAEIFEFSLAIFDDAETDAQYCTGPLYDLFPHDWFSPDCHCGARRVIHGQHPDGQTVYRIDHKWRAQ